jgi:hypothetical protein
MSRSPTPAVTLALRIDRCYVRAKPERWQPISPVGTAGRRSGSSLALRPEVGVLRTPRKTSLRATVDVPLMQATRGRAALQ